MDITKRINFSLALLLLVLTALVVAENFKSHGKTKAVKRPFSAQVTPQTQAVKNLFSGSAGDEYTGTAVADEVFVAQHHDEGAEQEQPLRGEGFKIQNVFTKTNRGTWMAPPEGFFSALTNNYLIYRENLEINGELKSLLENLHGNFVLDVVPFSLFSKFNRVFLMLFRTKENYSTYTLRPSWSIAATDVDMQSIYILENDDFEVNFVHELTHIYFDGFFLPSKTPLWLSEGFAVYMQGTVYPPEKVKWLARNIQSFKKGQYIDFKEFLEAKNLKGYSKEDVLMWYSQAYSVVRFLLKDKSRDEYYQFCKNLKEDMPLGRALYRAYGMPFNTAESLEYAWQADSQAENNTNAGNKKI